MRVHSGYYAFDNRYTLKQEGDFAAHAAQSRRR